MNRFLYAEGNPWTFIDPSGHMIGCASASSDLCNETTAVKHKNTPAGKKAAKTVSAHDTDPCHGLSGSSLAACRVPSPMPVFSTPQSTPCSSSLCNPNAPTTATEQSWSDWGQFDWSSVGASSCTKSDPCLPQGFGFMGVYGLTPYSSPVSSYACHAECQAEGAKDAALLVGVTVATYAASAVVLSAIGEWAATHPDQAAELGGGAEGAGVPADHVVLGMQNGDQLGQTAASVGGRTLMSDPNWRLTLMQVISDPTARLTVTLDGVTGTNPYSMVMRAAQLGATPGASNFNWEMAQLFQAGRLPTVQFMLGGTPIANPFAP